MVLKWHLRGSSWSDTNPFFQQAFIGILILSSLSLGSSFTSHGAHHLGCKSSGLGVQYLQKIVPLSLSAGFLPFLQKPWYPPPLSLTANNTYPESMQSMTTTSTKPYVSDCFCPSAFPFLGQRYHHGHNLLTLSLPLPFPIHSPINCPNREIWRMTSTYNPFMTPIALQSKPELNSSVWPPGSVCSVLISFVLQCTSPTHQFQPLSPPLSCFLSLSVSLSPPFSPFLAILASFRLSYHHILSYPRTFAHAVLKA